MGARSKTAWRVVYGGRKSLWALSHCGPVDRTLSKSYFEQRGLWSLEILYRGQPRFVVAQEQLTLDLDSCGRKRRRRSKGLSSPTPSVPKSRM
jgi:RNA-directed DNA polymerase